MSQSQASSGQSGLLSLGFATIIVMVQIIGANCNPCAATGSQCGGSSPPPPPPPSPYTLQRSAGNGQVGPVGTTLPQDLTLHYSSTSTGNAAPATTVAWSASGGGTITPRSAQTDPSTGLAAAQWTLGQTAGPQTATATIGSFSLQWTAAAYQMVIESGDNQQATVGSAVVLQVRLDAGGATLPYATIGTTWQVKSGAGTLATPTAGLDVNYIATNSLTPTQAGQVTVGAWPTNYPAHGVTFTATGTVPVPQSRIAFVTTRDGNQEIYVINANGTGLANLTQNSANDGGPRWSFDGSHIVFASDRTSPGQPPEIWVMDASGKSPTQLTHNPALDDGASWSPDGAQIVFQSSRSGITGLHLMPAAGDAVAPTLLEQGASDPDWLLNSTSIVYETSAGISVLDPHCSGNTCPRTLIPGTQPGDRSPVYSPDQTKIAFARGKSIWTMNIDGSHQTQLTNQDDDQPTWSPNSAQIAFSSKRSGCATRHVFIVDVATGTNVQQLTGAGCPSYDDMQPHWR